jgi:parvulin-like peptidyl-prolyl isomerase
MKLVFVFITALLMLPISATATVARAAEGADATVSVSDVIAKVGDQTITFSEINTALNSSAIVGVSIPALGTPQRDAVRVTLLDKFISSNLIYLDALKQGADKDPAYLKPVHHFENAILAGLYRKHFMADKIQVSEDEIQDYYKRNIVSSTKLDDDLRTQIEATIRREKLRSSLMQADKSLRDGIKIHIYEDNLDSAGDAERADDTPLADVGDETITWWQIKERLYSAGKGATKVDALAFENDARKEALENEIDLRILAQKARQAGLESDPMYQARVNEYRKTLLITMYRSQLAKTMEPTEKVLREYYEKNKQRIIVPDARKIQVVVVKTKEEATSIMDRIKAGEITLYQAARDYSIAANAKNDLGEMGWVNKGEVVPALDKVIFELGPGEIGGPVEAPAGWFLVKIQEVSEARFTDFSDEGTRKLARRSYLHEKLNDYTVNLRKNQFAVEVYQDRLVQLSQQEADMVKTLAEKSEQPGSVTKQRIEEMQKLMNKNKMPSNPAK